MKNVFKRILASILVLLSVQTCTYFILGKNALQVDYYDHFISYAMFDGTLCIYLEEDLSQQNKDEIAEKLEDRYSKIEFSTDSTAFRNKFDDPEVYTAGFSIEWSFPFRASILEGNGSAGYGESHASEFIWCFGKWILLEKECTGQS